MYREVIAVCYEQIKNRLYARHAYYYSSQNLLSFHLLSKSVKIEVQNVIICLFYVRLKLGLSHCGKGLVFGNSLLMKIFGRKREKDTRW